MASSDGYGRFGSTGGSGTAEAWLHGPAVPSHPWFGRPAVPWTSAVPAPDDVDERVECLCLELADVPTLDAWLRRRPGLRSLRVTGGAVTAVPPTIAGCDFLEELVIAAPRLVTLTPQLFQLPLLRKLAILGGAGGLELPSRVGSPAPLTHLVIRDTAGLTNVPSWLQKFWSTLTHLDLSHNRLERIHRVEFARFCAIEYVDLSHNALAMPADFASLADCDSLRTVVLRPNPLSDDARRYLRNEGFGDDVIGALP